MKIRPRKNCRPKTAYQTYNQPKKYCAAYEKYFPPGEYKKIVENSANRPKSLSDRYQEMVNNPDYIAMKEAEYMRRFGRPYNPNNPNTIRAWLHRNPQTDPRLAPTVCMSTSMYVQERINRELARARAYNKSTSSGSCSKCSSRKQTYRGKKRKTGNKNRK